MAQIGGENRELEFNVLSGAVSPQKRRYREAMSEIMETRTRVVRWPSQTDLSRQLPENRMDILDQQLAPALRDKEVGAIPPGGIFVTQRRVVEMDSCGRRMQWYKARLPELRVADGEDTLLQINIFAP